MAVNVDEKLIEQIAGGSRGAFRRLYDLAGSAVYGYALSILKNSHDAEDVMQETFVKIYHSAGTYQPSGKPMAWILTITKNLCYNRLRSDRSFEDITEFEHVAASEDKSLNSIIIEEAMKVLDDQERQIVILHSITGLKHREIADIVGIPLSTVLSKYNRGLKKMKTAIEERGV